MGFFAEVQTQVLMVNYYIVCRFDDGRRNDLKNYRIIKIFSMFSSLCWPYFQCVLDLHKIFYFLCWSNLLYKWNVPFENSK
jgi:hypothetical protein